MTNEELTQGSFALYLRVTDSDGFYVQLLKDYGIQMDWLSLTGSHDDIEGCSG